MPKSQKQSKKKLSVSKDTPKEIRHLGVLMESMNDKIMLVAEHTSGITSDVAAIKKTLEIHSRIFESHAEMIAVVATDVGIIKEDIEFIKHGLKKKVDVDEFIALERRVALLERKR